MKNKKTPHATNTALLTWDIDLSLPPLEWDIDSSESDAVAAKIAESFDRQAADMARRFDEYAAAMEASFTAAIVDLDIDPFPDSSNGEAETK